MVGIVRGAHGVRGELRVIPQSDNPDRFRAGRRLIVAGLGEREILAVRGTSADVILRLSGIADREHARSLAGRELRVTKDEARNEARGVLWADLVGLHVQDESGDALGTLAEVIRPGSATDVFVVRDGAGGELLLPAIDSVVLRIDLAAGVVVVRPLEEA